MSDILKDAFKHHLWANLGILDACDGVADSVLDATVAGTYGTVRDTLVHLCAAEQRYLSHMTGGGDSPGPLAEGGFPGIDELRRQAEANGRALIDLAERAEANEVIRGEARGERYALPISIFFA